MSYGEITPDELRAMEENPEGSVYAAILFTPRLLAMLVEEGAKFGNGYIVGVDGWSGRVLYDPDRKEHIPVYDFRLTINEPAPRPAPSE